jgi:hypothetical protein
LCDVFVAALNINIFKENVKIFQDGVADISMTILQKLIDNFDQILHGDFMAQNSCKFVDRASNSLLGHGILRRSQFQVELTVAVPVSFPCDINKGWEIDRGIVGHILARGFLSCVDEEIDDALVDSAMIFEASNKWPNILEGRSPHYLGVLVLQKAIIQVLQISCSFVDLGLLCEFCDDVSACLAHLFFLILSESIFVKWEESLLETI